jgi:4'-phosphopantetheinyl transferase
VVVRWTSVERVLRVEPDPERRLHSVDARRAREFGSPAARAAFVAGRWLRDDVLSRTLGVEAGALRFAIGPRGKPSLAEPADVDLAFNLSHSHGIVALAVARTRDLGLDVEAVRPLPAAARLAQRFLAPAEREAVMRRRDADRIRAFLSVWTRKEAWLKATGRGLSVHLSAVEVEPHPDRPPVLLALPEGCGDPIDWSMRTVPLPVDAVATVCLPTGDWRLDVAEWHPPV